MPNADAYYWRSIISPNMVHAFADKETRTAVCGMRVRWSWGWTLAHHDADRCRTCERLISQKP